VGWRRLLDVELDRCRAAVIKALPQRESDFHANVALPFDFDPFGERRHVQVPGDPDERFDQLLVSCRGLIEIANQGNVEIQIFRFDFDQFKQAGLADAEIIASQTDAKIAQQFASELARRNHDDAADIAKLGNGLRIVSAGFDNGTKVFEADDDFSLDSERSSIVLRIQRQRFAVASRLDDDLQKQYFDRQAPLSSLFSSSKTEWSHLESAIRLPASRLVVSEISHVWTDQLFSGNSPSVDEVGEQSTPETEITEAAPDVLALGGVKRLLVLAPHRDAEAEAWSQKTAQAAGQPVAFVPAEDNCVTFCYETEHTSLHNVIAGLIGDNRNSVKLAERLHSRIDIDWPPIR